MHSYLFLRLLLPLITASMGFLVLGLRVVLARGRHQQGVEGERGGGLCALLPSLLGCSVAVICVPLLEVTAHQDAPSYNHHSLPLSLEAQECFISHCWSLNHAFIL